MDDSPDIFGDNGTAPASGVAEGGEEELRASAAELEAAGQGSMFGDPEPVSRVAEERASAPVPPPAPPPGTPSAAQPYRVLARKYRPQTFAALIGQDAMVQTLANAIRRDRLAHAFLMTGVRGVGKTSTARLIAKALNCIGPDGGGGPTIDPCGQCEPCCAIAEGRHIDVIEMDAASHTGVDDVREIIEAVRYAAVSARYKIYIIDEVHMLSRNAFNALLKTLEEPPAHVKFLFATTEVDKLPVTVLSRCQRFDLRRIPAGMLAEHFAKVCEAEGVRAEGDALAMIAEAAEGSVRDGLSILDQAIAHSESFGAEAARAEQAGVTATQVREMLGLADRSVSRRLFAALLGGDAAVLLDLVAHHHALGVEPLALIRSAMELTHRVTVCQVGRAPAEAIAPEERAAIEDWAQRLSAGQLHRLWQLLAKGYDEVKSAPEPLIAAEMAMLRCLHAADMPDPGQLAKRLEEAMASGVSSAPATTGTSGPPSPAPSAAMDWAALVDRIDHGGSLTLASKMRMQVRVVELAPGLLRYGQPPGFTEDFAAEMRAGLEAATGTAWRVERLAGSGEGRATLVEEAEAARAAEVTAMRASPLVAAAMAAFPGAEILEENASGNAGVRDWQRRNRA